MTHQEVPRGLDDARAFARSDGRHRAAVRARRARADLDDDQHPAVAANQVELAEPATVAPRQDGEPLTFEVYRDHRPAAQARRAITDEVIKAIGGLSGQEYVPMYASVRKDEQSAQAVARHQD